MERNLSVAAVKVDVPPQDVVRVVDLDPCQMETAPFGQVFDYVVDGRQGRPVSPREPVDVGRYLAGERPDVQLPPPVGNGNKDGYPFDAVLVSEPHLLQFDWLELFMVGRWATPDGEVCRVYIRLRQHQTLAESFSPGHLASFHPSKSGTTYKFGDRKEFGRGDGDHRSRRHDMVKREDV